jgi:hypothetical protein
VLTAAVLVILGALTVAGRFSGGAHLAHAAAVPVESDEHRGHR